MVGHFKVAFRYLVLASLVIFVEPFTVQHNSPVLAQSRSISIYFEYKSSEIPSDAKQLVDLINGDIKMPSRVTIIGHCDTSEADADKLSLERAMEVGKALVALGLPAGTAITVIGKGTTELRKPTGPNEREPRNRFVSITID